MGRGKLAGTKIAVKLPLCVDLTRWLPFHGQNLEVPQGPEKMKLEVGMNEWPLGVFQFLSRE